MAVFVSYSHTDKDFVDRLAMELVRRDVHIWLDRWEIHVGESLLTKVQDAITGASGLLVILSKASVKSEWCTKELNSGLMRELEEKRVVLLPVLIEDCKIPLFLKEKLYADFRTNFEEGVRTVVAGVANVTNEFQGRFGKLEWHTDWSIDWGDIEGRHWFRLTMVSHGTKSPYVVLGTTTIYTNELSSRWYDMELKDDSDHLARREIIRALAAHFSNRPETDVILSDAFPVSQKEEIEVGPVKMLAVVEVRRLGMDTGGDVYFRCRGQFNDVVRTIDQITKQESEEKLGSRKTKKPVVAPKKTAPPIKKATTRGTKKRGKKV